MLDVSSKVFGAEPRRLACMLSPGWEQQGNWGADEFSAILRHQLAAPLEIDLGGTKWMRHHRSAGEGRRRPRMTYRDLLHQAKPRVELLRLVKEFAKAHLRPADAFLPREIAHVLYYASIVVARCQCGLRISRLTDAALLEGVDWVLSQPWVDEDTRSLFVGARALLQPG
jgi:hypothetical protein